MYKIPTLAIIDDHDLFRDLIVNYFNHSNLFKITYSEKDSHLLYDILKSNDTPDLLLLDLRLSSESGIDVIKEIRKRGFKIKILAFTMFHQERILNETIAAGANGYITKNLHFEKFVSALYEVIRNDKILVENENQDYSLLSKKEISDYVKKLPKLTKRETEFMSLCIDATLTYKEIAYRLKISPKTVDKYRENLFKKLNIKSKAELILAAKELSYWQLTQ